MKSFHFRRLQKRYFFFPAQILILRMLRNNADGRRCSYFELGLPVVWTRPILENSALRGNLEFFFFPRISGNFQESRHKWPQAFSDPKWNSWDLPCSLELALWWEAWVASDSALVRRESREGSKNKNNGGGGGGWRVEKETFARSKPHNQTRYVLFTCVADLYLSDLWSQIKNALDWYLFESCLCESLSDLSSSKYSWR